MQYTQKAFGENNICEVMHYLSICLKVTLDRTKAFASEWHKFDYHTKQLEDYIKLSTHTNLCSNVSLLKFQITMYGIFIETPLNSRWRLKKRTLQRNNSYSNRYYNTFVIGKERLILRKLRRQLVLEARRFLFHIIQNIWECHQVIKLVYQSSAQ